MAFTNKFTDKLRNKKKQKPQESAPIISRTGKIGRKSVESLPPEKEKQAVSEKTNDRAVQNGVTISDREFTEKANARMQKKKNKRIVHTLKSKEKTPFPAMTVVFCVICTVLFMTMIVNLVQINEYSKDVSELTNRVNTLNKEKNDLQNSYNEKNNSEILRGYLREHADEMGMVEEGMMNPPVSVTPRKDDTVNDYEAEEKEDSIVTIALNALAENLINAWNKFAGNE